MNSTDILNMCVAAILMTAIITVACVGCTMYEASLEHQKAPKAEHP